MYAQILLFVLSAARDFTRVQAPAWHAGRTVWIATTLAHAATAQGEAFLILALAIAAFLLA